MPYCLNCGNFVEEKFCTNCGQQIENIGIHTVINEKATPQNRVEPPFIDAEGAKKITTIIIRVMLFLSGMIIIFTNPFREGGTIIDFFIGLILLLGAGYWGELDFLEAVKNLVIMGIALGWLAVILISLLYYIDTKSTIALAICIVTGIPFLILVLWEEEIDKMIEKNKGHSLERKAPLKCEDLETKEESDNLIRKRENEQRLSTRQQYAAYTHYHRRRPPY